MDIFEYPQELNKLEVELSTLRNEKDTLEVRFRDLKAATIVSQVDIIAYKSAAIRENFIIFTLANNSECVKMETRLNEIIAQIRIKTDEHSKLRREFRLLELEYNAHGIRNFANCGKT